MQLGVPQTAPSTGARLPLMEKARNCWDALGSPAVVPHDAHAGARDALGVPALHGGQQTATVGGTVTGGRGGGGGGGGGTSWIQAIGKHRFQGIQAWRRGRLTSM